MPSHTDPTSLLLTDSTPAAPFSDDTSWLRNGDLRSYPACERARDQLISLAKTPQSRHLPRGVVSYFPEASVIAFFESGREEQNVGKTVWCCNCAKCQKQAGRNAGIEYRRRTWSSKYLQGDFASIFALLIYLRCPALILLFRQKSLTLSSQYLTPDSLDFLDVEKNHEILALLDGIQARNIRAEILSIQYRFRVPSFSIDTVYKKLSEDEILPIKEKQIASGEGNFGEVYEMDIDPGYISQNLKDLKVSVVSILISKLPVDSS